MRLGWRYYRTRAGRSPVEDFLDGLPDDARIAVMLEIRKVTEKPERARHLRGDLYEVRASHFSLELRVIFSIEGRTRHVLLGLEAFQKQTQRTPSRLLDVAAERLADWRARGKLASATQDPGRKPPSRRS